MILMVLTCSNDSNDSRAHQITHETLGSQHIATVHGPWDEHCPISMHNRHIHRYPIYPRRHPGITSSLPHVAVLGTSGVQWLFDTPGPSADRYRSVVTARTSLDPK